MLLNWQRDPGAPSFSAHTLSRKVRIHGFRFGTVVLPAAAGTVRLRSLRITSSPRLLLPWHMPAGCKHLFGIFGGGVEVYVGQV